MVNLNQFRTVFLFIMVASISAQAEIRFVDLLKSLNPDKQNVVTELPYSNDLMSAQDIKSAEKIMIEKQPVFDMNKSKGKVSNFQIASLLKRKNTTIVIVPGVLGEFIDGRAFEEIFSRPSTYGQKWQELVERSQIYDERFALEKMATEQVPLGDVVNAASIDDKNGRPLLKLVILKNIFGSLESVGSNQEIAKILNRRIEKYINLTGDKNIVLLGYSRGAPLALEMVTQAQKNKLTYLSKVKAVVSYAGVLFGTALADVTADPNSESGRLLLAVKKLRNELQLSYSILDRPFARANNTDAISTFVSELASNSDFDANFFLSNARSGDFKTVAALISKVSSELGLMSLGDFNGHVLRTQKFIDEIILAVDELKSDSLIKWWSQNNLPSHIKYISIAAAMVDPQNSEVEKEIFDSSVGYNNSLDDMSLINNMRLYKEITGIAMNDSQVALHQSVFLKKTIAQLNPANSKIDFRNLGVLQTHHWGVSLQVVNKMKDERLNPFPREKVLLALTAYLNQLN
jgi:hypothetical protein